MTNPGDVFLNYDGDPVPEEEWPTFLRYVLPQALRHWPRPVVEEAARGQPIPVAANLPTGSQLDRIDQVLRTLRQDTRVEEERQQLSAIVAAETERRRSQIGGDPVLDPVFREMVWLEADRFASEVEVAGVSRRDVLTYLFATATFPDQTSGPDSDAVYRSSFWSVVLLTSRAAVWANLSRRQISFKLDPGQIVVDVSHSSEADLKALWNQIRDTQKRLGSVRSTGGRHREDERAARIEELQRMGKTWREIYPIILEEYHADDPSSAPTLGSLKRMQTDWRARTGRGRPPRK